MIKQLRDIPVTERLGRSKSISHNVLRLPVVEQAQRIMVYVSMADEVDTTLIIDHALSCGQCVGLPVTDPSVPNIKPYGIRSLAECQPGAFGILEPNVEMSSEMPLDQLDVILVPGVVFDRNGHRIGRGGGFYDRFLAKIPPHIPTVGLAFDVQIIDSIPHIEHHDMRLSVIITETEQICPE
jgi:5-formyltetrahydrofolate cyclo-ligase